MIIGVVLFAGVDARLRKLGAVASVERARSLTAALAARTASGVALSMRSP
jgi:hypothetical protein